MSSNPEIEGGRKGSRASRPASREQLSLIRWTADLGAVTAEALAHREQVSLASARGRLRAATQRRLLAAARPLRLAPTLYTVTPAGMRLAGCGLDPCRVSPGNASHLIACAAVAAGLERCYPDHLVAGERDLRRREREQGTSLASASLGRAAQGRALLHRPDLVLWPRGAAAKSLPLAVEVELTVKAPRRLEQICRAWARCDRVAGVLYLAAPAVERPLRRAIERAGAQSRVIAVSLSAVPGPAGDAIPSDA